MQPENSKDPIENLVYLEYVILFNPETSWANIHDFEKDLTDFFSAYGLEINIINTANNLPGKRVLLIKRANVLERPIVKEEIQTEQKEMGMKEILAKARQKRGFDGKYRGVNR